MENRTIVSRIVSISSVFGILELEKEYGYFSYSKQAHYFINSLRENNCLTSIVPTKLLEHYTDIPPVIEFECLVSPHSTSTNSKETIVEIKPLSPLPYIIDDRNKLDLSLRIEQFSSDFFHHRRNNKFED